MPGSLRRHRSIASVVLAGAVGWITLSVPAAQQAPPLVHHNPMIAKLSRGQAVFGVSTSDLSIDNAHSIARAPLDSVRIEMEHGPLDFSGLRTFLIGMIDKAEILRKGSGQPNVAPWARFPPDGRERSDWIAKQALDMGLMGVAFNGIDNEEQTLNAVRSMRYPQPKGARFPEPAGLRGYSPSNAL